MSNNKIFDNYKDKCPICGAELDSNYKICPYCGNDLIDENAKYRDDEQKILDAFDDIESAKRSLAETERILNDSQKEKRKPRVLKWILIFIIGFPTFLIGAAIVSSLVSISNEKQLEDYVDKLHMQKVNTIEIESKSLEDIEFKETTNRTPCGYMLESENYLQIPFYADCYDNDLKVTGTITFEKGKLRDVYTADSDYCSISFEEYSFSVRVENSPYYNRAIDTVNIYDKDVVRLENIKIGEYEFECYLDDLEDYTFVCDLGYDCYIEFSPHFYLEDGVSIEEAFKIANIDIIVE